MKKILSLALAIIILSVFTDTYAYAAVAKPLVKATTSIKSEYKPGDIVAFNVSAANFGTKRVQYRIITSAPGKTTDTGYGKLTYIGKGSYPVRIPVQATGTYTVSVFVRRAGVNVSYDNYIKLTFKVVKPVNATISAADPAYDINNLRANANFRVKVAEDVNWVPANTLGKPSMTINEMKKIIGSTPEVLRDKIKTVYDVIMYIRLSDYKSGGDNRKEYRNNIEVEIPETGEESIITNDGNCASITALANYLLDGDYQEIGMIQYNRISGGHVLNYVKLNDKYYAIDYTHYRNDMLDSTAVESGNINDYYKSDIVAGNIHEMNDMKSYVTYIRDKYNEVPEFLAMYQAANPSRVGSRRIYSDGRALYFPKELNFNVLYYNPNDNLVVNFIDGL